MLEREDFMELKMANLTKQYGSKTAVNHLDISLSGGVYGLLGPNGAGKTTLMRLLCAVLKPTCGNITLDGQGIADLGGKYRMLLGYLPQHFGYYPSFTALDFLRYAAALKGLDEKKAKRESMEALETVNLANESRRKIKAFSGGMKQRLGIAQALLGSPRILILDEPAVGLDPKERIRLRNLISTFSKDRMVLLSTHSVTDVECIAQQIMVMQSGRLCRCGRPDEILAEIEGMVWECAVPASRAQGYAERFCISNSRKIDAQRTVLRVIAEHPPAQDAVQVPPTLEDWYLFHFKGGRAS